jgi:hypothetical protein
LGKRRVAPYRLSSRTRLWLPLRVTPIDRVASALATDCRLMNDHGAQLLRHEQKKERVREISGLPA